MENGKVAKGMLDLGASINLITHDLYQELSLGKLEPVNMTLQMADCSIQKPLGIIRDALVKVDTFLVPADFVVLPPSNAATSSKNHVIMLGRPFMKTVKL